MKRRLKFILVAVLILTCLISIFYAVGNYSSGNFWYAQKYEFNISKSQLINIVEQLKANNRSLNPPIGFTGRDSLDAITGNFDVYIYYPDQNSVVYFFINSGNQIKNQSYINFVSINEGSINPIFKIVNKDFDGKDNRKVKKDFEDRILEKLGPSYQNKGNGMFVFWK